VGVITARSHNISARLREIGRYLPDGSGLTEEE
jgi:hypothetical protein